MTLDLSGIAPARAAQLVATDGRTYPLRSALVRANARGGLAGTTLVQRFANPHAEPLEVVYTLPLPADGAVLGYTVRMGEREIHGEIQAREAAKKAYREALYQGLTAGLLESERDDTFQQSLGNVPAGTDVEIEIEVLHPLAFDPATGSDPAAWVYRFPTVAGIRYVGEPGRVPDSGRIDPNRDDTGAIPARMELQLQVEDAADGPVGLRSPSHSISHEFTPAGVVVCFDEPQRLDRDVVVCWPACRSDVGLAVTEGSGLKGDRGRYALLTVTPPALPAAAFARDLTVLIDASGSMSGEPIELAKRVVSELLDGLGPEDRFELIAFANRPSCMTRGLVRAGERELREARSALAGLRADGATEMDTAFEEALRPLRGDSQRQVVLVSDGEIGFESEVLGRLARSLPAGSRAHAVGIGSAPNRTLLRGVARAGRGVEVLVTSDVECAAAARRLSLATARPVLTELQVAGSAVREVAPHRPHDVFAGSPVVLTVELQPGGGTIEVTGRLAGSPQPWSASVSVPAAGGAGLERCAVPVGALHGREIVSDLELERAAGTAGLEKRIEERGLRHRIVTSQTSLVAIAEEPGVDPKAPRRRERVAVEVPFGVSAMGAGLGGAMMSSAIIACMEPDAVMMRPSAAALPWAREDAFHRAAEPASPEIRVSVEGILLIDGDVLVVEIETPEDGFELPKKVTVCDADGTRIGEAELIAADSSPRGPHEAGLSVRIALRFRKGAWPLAQVRLTWSLGRGWGRGSSAAVIHLPDLGGIQTP